jgi:ATP-binding cassette subfamily B (MDR/TAP) protein 1
VYCWTAAGERQTQKFRARYVSAVLSQEMGWFDSCGAGELATRVSEYTAQVQDGMGRKIGELIQNGTQIVACLAVAFYLQAKITAVLLCSIPAIGIAGAFMIGATTSASNQALEQYAAAGGLASETLDAIRTVTALNMQPSVISQYRISVFNAMKVGIVKGLKVGMGNGAVFGVSFLTYALGFWYGAQLVAHDHSRGCDNPNHCVTGGTVISVFFATLMGSYALGQVRFDHFA